MYYAICYVSTANDLLKFEVDELLNATATNNKLKSISGLLIYNSGNFFQYMEGRKEDIENLYFKKIADDKRHRDPILLMQKDINTLYFDGYETGFTSILEKNTVAKLRSYIKLLKYLDTSEVEAVTSTIETFLGKVSK